MLFKNLASLDLSRNVLQYISPTAFVNLTSITTLNLANNILNVMQEQIPSEFENLLMFIPNLVQIDLSNNYLKTISDIFFDHNRHLKYVLLSNNKFSTFHGNVPMLPHLIDLHNNFIFFIDKDTVSWSQKINESVRNDTFEIDLRGNIFQCSCKYIFFAQWLLKSTYVKKDSPVQCYLNNNKVILNSARLTSLIESCKDKEKHPIDLWITLAVLTPITIFAIFCIRHFLHRHLKKRAGQKNKRNALLNLEANTFEYKYIVFLVFSNEDKDLVRKYFYPLL